jgi:hypothetical protein
MPKPPPMSNHSIFAPIFSHSGRKAAIRCIVST